MLNYESFSCKWLRLIHAIFSKKIILAEMSFLTGRDQLQPRPLPLYFPSSLNSAPLFYSSVAVCHSLIFTPPCQKIMPPVFVFPLFKNPGWLRLSYVHFHSKPRVATWTSLGHGACIWFKQAKWPKVCLGTGAPLLPCGFGYRSTSWKRRDI